MVIKRAILPALLVSGLSYAVPILNVDVNAGYMMHSISGNIKYPADNGFDIDLNDTLGLKGTNNFMARAKVELPIIPNVYAQYMPMTFEKKDQSIGQITFGNTTYTGTVSTVMKLDRLDVALYYNVPFIGLATGGLLDAEVGINARITQFDIKLRGEAGGQTVEEKAQLNIPIPMLYASGALNLGPASVIAEIRAITFQSIRYYDITGELRFSPFGLPGLAKFYGGVGYRMESFQIDKPPALDASMTININSPFINVGVAF